MFNILKYFTALIVFSGSFAWSELPNSHYICRKGNDVKRIQVLVLAEGACSTLFTANGRTLLLKTGSSVDVCLDKMKTVQERWVQGGWSCRGADSAEASIRILQKNLPQKSVFSAKREDL